MPTQWSQEAYLTAWRFAAEAHHGQAYPGTELSYLLHVGAVAMEVLGALAVESLEAPDLAVQCALLHDVLEDTAVAYPQLVDVFGEPVADGVQALTKREDLTKAEAMADSLARIREQPREVWWVKLADRITNLQTPPHFWSAEKTERYRVEAETILATLGEASPFLAGRLRGKIAGYGR